MYAINYGQTDTSGSTWSRGVDAPGAARISLKKRLKRAASRVLQRSSSVQNDAARQAF